jgi:hypothetical protein
MLQHFLGNQPRYNGTNIFFSVDTFYKKYFIRYRFNPFNKSQMSIF